MTDDVETARLAKALETMPEVVGRYDDVLRGPDAPRRLWQAAAADVRNGQADDRALYWARLKMQRERRRRGLPTAAGERSSRGFDFDWPQGRPTAFVTGFDPFRLRRNIAQSNPAGFAALALHGATIAGVGVRAAVLPVRFADFDRGMVEELLTPVLRRSPVLLLTISMGRDRFDVERFPGRRRSSATLDNRDIRAAGTPREPLPPPGLAGPEFLETTLPVAAMTSVGKGRWAVRDNRRVRTLRRGAFAAQSLADLAGEASVRGSGGGFLSNEVAYRSLWLGQALGVAVPTGHLHVPKLVGWDRAFLTDVAAQVRRIVEAALRACREASAAANAPGNG